MSVENPPSKPLRYLRSRLAGVRQASAGGHKDSDGVLGASLLAAGAGALLSSLILFLTILFTILTYAPCLGSRCTISDAPFFGSISILVFGVLLAPLAGGMLTSSILRRGFHLHLPLSWSGLVQGCLLGLQGLFLVMIEGGEGHFVSLLAVVAVACVVSERLIRQALGRVESSDSSNPSEQ